MQQIMLRISYYIKCTYLTRNPSSATHTYDDAKDKVNVYLYFSGFTCDLFSLIRMNAAVLEISDTALNEMTFSFSSNAFLSRAFTCYCPIQTHVYKL